MATPVIEIWRPIYFSGVELYQRNECSPHGASALACRLRSIPETPWSPKAVRLVREYLIDNHDQNISSSALARLAGLGPFHLARAFKDTIGMLPHIFPTQVRLEQAKHLLRKGRLLARVAAECGLADQSHLIRRFKRFVGVTPADYRASVT